MSIGIDPSSRINVPFAVRSVILKLLMPKTTPKISGKEVEEAFMRRGIIVEAEVAQRSRGKGTRKMTNYIFVDLGSRYRSAPTIMGIFREMFPGGTGHVHYSGRMFD